MAPSINKGELNMLKRVVCAVLFFGIGLAHAFVPQTGTWVVTSELNGKPGRGIAFDVQNETLVMQMYAYEQNGQPTFYMGVGRITADSMASVPLGRYSGGRYFGSGAQSGADAGSPGTVSLRFTSGITGFATFPGEPEKAISRYNFGYPFTAPSLKGIWSLTSIGSQGLQAEVGALSESLPSTDNGNGLVASPDGLFGCEHQVKGNLAGLVLCIRITSQGQLVRGYMFTYSVNEGEGRQFTATGAQTDQLVFVRRLTTASGIGTGIFFKSDAVSAANFGSLRQQMSEVAARVQPD